MPSNQPIHANQNPSKVQRFRLSLLAVLLVLMTFILILRLAYLQLSEFKRYQTLSLKNQMNIIPVAPTRGVIFDKNGVVLAENIPVYALEVIPERVKDMKDTLARLQALIPSITDEDIENFNQAKKQYRSYSSTPIKLKLSAEDVAVFASNQYLFPGVSIKARLIRHYPLGKLTAHLLGYVGRINENELKIVDPANYRATNFIGKTGIEKYYEPILHGQVGYQHVETDVSGRTLRTISKKNPISGTQLYLTIDSRLQEVTYEAMSGLRGAVVVMDVNNGEIRSMLSSPSYDPNLFINGISHKDYRQLLDDNNNPLFNRAVRGLYPPASTVKPFVAIAGLDHKFINEDDAVFDPGWYRLPGIKHKFRDWKRQGHGYINLKKAMTVSCDTYFYKLADKMGISVLEDIYMRFGFGQLTQVDLHEEAAGIVPGPSWKKRKKGTIWYPGDTLITAIGQGFMLATPLQLASATASIATQGKRYRPHLLSRLIDDQGQMREYKPIEEYPIQLKNPEIWQTITNSMQEVIKSRIGTGHRFGRNAKYTIAAKTGTAQVYSIQQNITKPYQDVPDALKDHSLFIAFAPIDNPDIAIAVLVENNHIASAIARKVTDAYFNLKLADKES